MPHLYIDSKNRAIGENANFVLILDRPRLIKSIQFEHIIIPQTYYTIDYHNDTIDIMVLRNTSAKTINHGRYSISELCIQIAISLGVDQFECIYDNNTNKFTINSEEVFQLLFGTGVNKNRSIASLIGFLNIDTAITVSVTGNTVVRSLEPEYLCLHSNALTSGLKNKVYVNDQPSNLLLRIPIKTITNERIYYTSDKLYFNYSDNEFINQKLDFRLTYSDGNLLELNGANWSMCLIIIE